MLCALSFLASRMQLGAVAVSAEFAGDVQRHHEFGLFISPMVFISCGLLSSRLNIPLHLQQWMLLSMG